MPFAGVTHSLPTPMLHADEGTPAACAMAPVTTEAYAVVLEILLGELQEAPVNRLPTLGPTKMPVEDTAVAVRPFISPSSLWATAAVNEAIPADSTNTSRPFKYDWLPVKPDRKKPSLIVGSIPMYVNVAVPYTREYPVMLRVVAYVKKEDKPGLDFTEPTV